MIEKLKTWGLELLVVVGLVEAAYLENRKAALQAAQQQLAQAQASTITAQLQQKIANDNVAVAGDEDDFNAKAAAYEKANPPDPTDTPPAAA